MFKENRIKVRISEIKHELHLTDYVDNKLTEAVVTFLIDGDKTALEMAYLEYKPMLAQRQAWRDEINEAERQLNEINKELNNGTL